MTRKDFEIIARALKSRRDSYAPHWDKNLFRSCDDHARSFADALEALNPRFDRAKFLAACGVQS